MSRTMNSSTKPSSAQGLLIVFGSLLAGMLGAFLALSVSGTPAVAMRMLPTDLGPADAMILSGKDGNVTVTNQEGRLSWSDSPSSRAYSVACVYIDPILKGILSGDRFSNDRSKFDEEAKIQGQEFERKSKALQEKYPDLKQGDAAYESARGEYKALQGEYEKWMTALQKVQSKHMAEQVEKAYGELIAAVDIVAERKKIDFVYRFIPPARAFESSELASAMMQVQARTFLRSPSGTDISEDVIKELGLPAAP